uniref:Uncharacterized protein n=1 Tax=Ananas comosus var. bracteatus TaxID=296719 RepID=A0A6V7PL98_ANACO|nr:unnamed protein product [Ananas comosus var. bracteatus]
MVRSKRLRDHEVTNLVLDESQTNGDDSSTILQSTSLDPEPSLDRSPASDSESLKSQPQVEEEVEIECDDTVEIIGNVKKKQMMHAKDENTMNAIAASSAAEPSKSSTNLENDYIKNTPKKDKYGRVLGYGNGPTPMKIFGLQSQLRDMDNEQKDPMKEEVKRLKAKMEVMQNKHDLDMLEIKSLLRQLVGQSLNFSTDIRDTPPS